MNIKKLINWWNSLEWDSDKDKQQFQKREKSLTWKELFFRDKKAILTTLFPLIILIIIFFSQYI